jgi:CRISPR-associated protein Cas1
LWPLESHHLQARRLATQIEAPKPLRKRLWQAIVVRKIECQAEALTAQGESDLLRGLAGRVRSGDPENMEAQAARRYWPKLFTSMFRRGDSENALNGFLNYGYAVIRSAMARAVAAVGLHPSLSVHHHDARNAFALVDDLMEPYRPLVDVTVRRLWFDEGERSLTPEVKSQLAGLLVTDLRAEVGVSPLFACANRTAASFAQSLEERVVALDYPLSILPC